MADRPADVITKSNPVIDAALLDAAAARVFRQAAVRLARERPQTDGAWQASREAAQALVSLAKCQDATALHRYLRPDPRVVEVVWTVACYQIGDLTPCALLDFANPVAAVTTLAGCGEAGHVAAELVAATPSGIRWTAMNRTGRAVTFQLPDGRSTTGAARDRNGELREASQRWRERLGQWAAEDAEEPDPVGDPKRTEGANELQPARAKEAAAEDFWGHEDLDAPVVPVAPAPGLAPPGGDLERALELVLKALRSMDARTRQRNAPADEIVVRLDALDQRLRDFQVAFERALDDRMEALARDTAEKSEALAAQQRAITSRLEARLDALTARLPPQDGARPIEMHRVTA